MNIGWAARPPTRRFYPKELILEMLRGIRDTEDAEALRQPELPADLVAAVQHAGQLKDVPAGLPVRLEAQELKQRLDKLHFPATFSDGTVVDSVPQFKDSYKDEYTGEILPHEHICTAIGDELP